MEQLVGNISFCSTFFPGAGRPVGIRRGRFGHALVVDSTRLGVWFYVVISLPRYIPSPRVAWLRMARLLQKEYFGFVRFVSRFIRYCGSSRDYHLRVRMGDSIFHTQANLRGPKSRRVRQLPRQGPPIKNELHGLFWFPSLFPPYWGPSGHRFTWVKGFRNPHMQVFRCCILSIPFSSG